MPLYVSKSTSETPLMKQYHSIKARYPDAILLFRVGDFYETFGQDAVRTSEVLDIVLTKRANGAAAKIELAGFPHHSLETYLPKLVRAGHRVAICDQLEDPKKTKTIVKRGVTELVTPGVTMSDQLLNARSNNFLCTLSPAGEVWGIALVDISTGEFLVSQGSKAEIEQWLQNFSPSEIIFPKRHKDALLQKIKEKTPYFELDEWVFKPDYTYELLNRQFETNSLKGFGIEDWPEAIIAAGAAIHYLRETEHKDLGHISGIGRIYGGDFLWMDAFTMRNLEVFRSNAPDGVSLVDTIDNSVSPMGGRLLRRWLSFPLKDVGEIEKRLDLVDFFTKNPQQGEPFREQIRQIHDLERLVSKVSTGRINPREIKQLRNGLAAIIQIKQLAKDCDNAQLTRLVDVLHPCEGLKTAIETTIADEPAVAVGKGKVIADACNQELDELRKLLYSGKEQLAQMQEREIQRTGIPNLKVAFNNVFGYYIEVRNTHKNKVPDDWIRKQTLVNAERYITEELKVYEDKIMGAEEKVLHLEQHLFGELIKESATYVGALQQNAQTIARLDCLIGFSQLALKNNFSRPEFTEEPGIEIREGRHPVIEKQLPPGKPYIPNDTVLHAEGAQIMMITGPNMAGKSALLRQTALISLLAQVGSFVPASSARLHPLDRIFVRVGASDNISQGESTFMVEMNETATILNNLSAKSLILLDEIGRGTSTYDGISIAWSIAQFLHEHPFRPLTLFATHYHELNEMEKTYERIRNFNVSVKEIKNEIVFLRKLAEGGSEHSFGIHVAKMAGLPPLVVANARSVLSKLESSRREQTPTELGKKDVQLSIFQLDDPLLEDIKEDIKNLDINALTPVEALIKLNELKRKLGM
ncbi:MAG: DNA mismatch repair protein MutS [Flavobacteriales bacterium]|nr:MAG: DNA mismatch repair protein MutS [Flavobacteriales bacterium]